LVSIYYPIKIHNIETNIINVIQCH
jgi:hypothetical protein